MSTHRTTAAANHEPAVPGDRGALAGRGTIRSMDTDLFVLRVRAAGESRLYRFQGTQAVELHKLARDGTLERPGGTRRLGDAIRGREPDRVMAGGSATMEEPIDFDMVADDELREWISQRLLERKAGREIGDDSTAPGIDEPSPA